MTRIQNSMATVDEGARRRFEQAWRAGAPESIDALLPPAGSPLYLPTLEELVHIELELSWKRPAQAGATSRPKVESYLRRFPQLNHPAIVLRLLKQEWQVRQAVGDHPMPAEFHDRFPQVSRTELDTMGASAPTLVGPLPAPEVPGYEILGELGRGGMGVVYKARHLKLDRIVALKMIVAGEHADPANRERLLAEAEVVAKLRHPHIVQVYDVGQHKGLPYFAMEYLEGGSLDRKLREAPLPPHAAARLVEHLAAALALAHHYGVVHRDLKPANVLLEEGEDGGQRSEVGGRRSEAGGQRTADFGTPISDLRSPTSDLRSPSSDLRPKIGDFGLARRVEGGAGLTRSGDVLGTAAYMAPEQASGKGKHVGPEADIYALGAILYECLTGRPPFVGPTSLETMLLVMSQDPVPPRQLQPAIPHDLETICLKCLRKEPEQRFAGAGELAEDLHRFQAGEPILARPIGWAERTVKWARRRPALAALLLVMLLAVLALAGGVVGTSLGLLRAWDAEAKARSDEKRAKEAEDQAREDKKIAEKADEQAQKDRKRAESDRAVAQALNDFLQNDLLGQADTRKQPLLDALLERDPDIRVRDLLDRAAAVIDLKFKDQPLTEAAIRSTIGDTYRALGEYEAAVPHLERALAVHREKLGEDDLETLRSKEKLAHLYHAQAEYTRAETLYAEVLKQREIKLGATNPDTLAAKNDLAELYLSQGTYEPAEQLFHEVLEAREVKLGADNPETLVSKHNLARLFHAQGKYALAEPLYRQVLELCEQKFGADHPDTLAGKTNLANLFMDQGKYEPAEEMYVAVLELEEKKLPADHPQTLTTRNNLAMVYKAEQKYEKSEKLYRDLIERQERKLGPEHAHTLTTRSNLAALFIEREKYDLAEPILRDVLAVQEKKWSSDHPDALRTRSNLALVYEAQGDYDHAEPMLRELVKLSEKKFGAEHPDTLRAKNNLAGLYMDLRKFDRAEVLLRQVLSSMVKKPGADHPNTMLVRGNLANLYIQTKKWDRAEPLLVEQLAVKEKQIKKDTEEELELANLQSQLGSARLELKKPAEAEPLLRECLALREKHQPDAWSTFGTKAHLGTALVGLKKYEDAEKLLIDGYEGMKSREEKIPAPAKNRLLETIKGLVELYESWEMKDKAEEWRKKLGDKE